MNTRTDVVVEWPLRTLLLTLGLWLTNLAMALAFTATGSVAILVFQSLVLGFNIGAYAMTKP